MTTVSSSTTTDTLYPSALKNTTTPKNTTFTESCKGITVPLEQGEKKILYSYI